MQHRDAILRPSQDLPEAGIGSPVPKAGSSQLAMVAAFREVAERVLLPQAPENILFPWSKQGKKMRVEGSPLELEVKDFLPSWELAFPAASLGVGG